jgi:radical SAM superfamily enzyme YgiQ (UPF0313 family)
MIGEQKQSFHLVLIKPSHYDDDGYVIQWARSAIPANSLAALYGLARECAERGVLGPNVEVVITAVDETNTRVRPDRIIRKLKAGAGCGLVCLVGVQSNQFPRALDIARPLRAAGIEVAIGGFHVSGTLAMLPELTPELSEALDLGITLFAGEAEGRFEELLRAAHCGTLEPIYNYMSDLPALEGAPAPYLPAEVVRKTRSMRTSFDAGRGCPFLCSFCTIINVQGRKSRSRSADDVERIVRDNLAQGIDNFFITDDNLARNQNWEAIFDRLIRLREEEGRRFYLMAQVDTMCHKIPGFIEKGRRAGITRVFIGLENINPEALKDAHKGQNRITEYRAMLQAWHRAGALIYAGYILGFPGDTPDSIERDIRIVQRELPIDILEFFILTPLPGSADHKRLYLDGVEMDPDLNKYDLAHVTTRHPRMSKEEIEAVYRKAWQVYYSPEHVETVLRRTRESGYDIGNMMMKLFSFEAPIAIDRIHPLEAGIFRRKYRRDRRNGLPLESPFLFYPRLGLDILWRAWRYAALYLRYRRILKRVGKDTKPYSDLAVAPVNDREVECLELYTSTRGGAAAAKRFRRRQAMGA